MEVEWFLRHEGILTRKDFGGVELPVDQADRYKGASLKISAMKHLGMMGNPPGLAVQLAAGCSETDWLWA